jgi:hypothetical protein
MNMMNFDDREQQFLVELLAKERLNLRDEIVHTDDHDYREFLKEREHYTDALLCKMQESKDVSTKRESLYL